MAITSSSNVSQLLPKWLFSRTTKRKKGRHFSASWLLNTSFSNQLFYFPPALQQKNPEAIRFSQYCNAIFTGCFLTLKSVCTHGSQVPFFRLPPGNKFLDKKKKDSWCSVFHFKETGKKSAIFFNQTFPSSCQAALAVIVTQQPKQVQTWKWICKDWSPFVTLSTR